MKKAFILAGNIHQAIWAAQKLRLKYPEWLWLRDPEQLHGYATGAITIYRTGSFERQRNIVKINEIIKARAYLVKDVDFSSQGNKA